LISTQRKSGGGLTGIGPRWTIRCLFPANSNAPYSSVSGPTHAEVRASSPLKILWDFGVVCLNSPAIAEFERGIMLERQREGIDIAKADGKYKGRKPINEAKLQQVQKLVDNGTSVSKAVSEVGIGRRTYYKAIELKFPKNSSGHHA
jgi:hypothetical protein